MNSLADIYEEYNDCQLCPLGKFRGRDGYNQIVLSKGPERANTMIIAEAPGEQEAKEGIPFVGRAGKLLDDLLAKAGLDIGKIHVTNTCLCRPPNNATPKQDEITSCMSRLARQIYLVRPKMLVLLGNVALKAITGKDGVTSRRGIIGMSEDVVGSEFRVRYIRMNGVEPVGIKVAATFHPSWALRSGGNTYDLKTAAILTDLKLFAKELAKSV